MASRHIFVGVRMVAAGVGCGEVGTGAGPRVGTGVSGPAVVGAGVALADCVGAGVGKTGHIGTMVGLAQMGGLCVVGVRSAALVALRG